MKVVSNCLYDCLCNLQVIVSPSDKVYIIDLPKHCLSDGLVLVFDCKFLSINYKLKIMDSHQGYIETDEKPLWCT